MLKVTVVDGRAEQRLMVEGKLVAPWVSELQSAWDRARRVCRGCRIVVDLSGTTTIDSSGKAALMVMIGEGARVTAKGIYTEHLVKGLIHQARKAAAREHKGNGASAAETSSTGVSSQAGQSSPSKERQ